MAKKVNPSMTRLPIGAIRPEGWLLKELLLVNGLQKRLGTVSGLLENGVWAGGEILPKYVRGVILLAGVLEDRALTEKAESFVETMFATGKEGGDFGPSEKFFPASKIEALKALHSYYELTGDEKVFAFLRKYFKNQFNTFSVTPYFFNARARLLEEIPAIEAVFKETDAEWLHDLGEKLRETGNDWFKYAASFKYKRPANRYLSHAALKKLKKHILGYVSIDGQAPQRVLTVDKANAEWKKSVHQKAVETNGVNVAKAIKYPCTWGKFIGDSDLKYHSLKLINALEKYHGNSTGMFGADFQLAGSSPLRGMDVESAVETLESLVEVLGETGNNHVADLVERIAFNVIPAVFDGVGAVQELVMANQVEASYDTRNNFRDSEFGNAYVAGHLSKGAVSLLSAYPTFLRSLCFTKDNELNFKCYAPCVIDTVVGGNRIKIKEETGYPFRNTIVFKVESAEGDPEVKINFRVPSGTSMQLVSGGQVVASSTTDISVKCILKTGSTFMLKLDIPLLVRENKDKTLTLMKGNLVMASKLAEEMKPSERGGVVDVTFLKKWTFAPVVNKRAVGGIRRVFDVEETVVNNFDENPFSHNNPPFELRIRSKNVTNWTYNMDGLAGQPKKPEFSEESMTRVYVPFGCTSIRICQFPPCFKN